MSIVDKIKALDSLPDSFYGNDFLLTWEKTGTELQKLVETTMILKELYYHNISCRIFDSGLAVSNFRDKSTRTRFSFASASNMLGLAVQDLDEEKSQISHGETVLETVNMLSFLTEVIGIRDDMYPGLGDSYQREVAEAVNFGYENGVLAQRPTVINLQSDLDHPTQTMADLAHLSNYFGGMENLKGKKIAVSWAYSPSYGKPLSVPQGLIALMSRMGMDITLTYPEGYDLLPGIVETARKNTASGGGNLTICHEMKEAFIEAEAVYPKSWAPLKIMRHRTELVKNNDRDGLQELEKEALSINARYKNWECNADMMSLTCKKKALYMHCLPADISGINCEAGEVSAEVFKKYQIETYAQAGFKPFVIAAMIFLTKVKEPSRALLRLVSDNKTRKIFDKSR